MIFYKSQWISGGKCNPDVQVTIQNQQCGGPIVDEETLDCQFFDQKDYT